MLHAELTCRGEIRTKLGVYSTALLQHPPSERAIKRPRAQEPSRILGASWSFVERWCILDRDERPSDTNKNPPNAIGLGTVGDLSTAGAQNISRQTTASDVAVGAVLADLSFDFLGGRLPLDPRLDCPLVERT